MAASRRARGLLLGGHSPPLPPSLRRRPSAMPISLKCEGCKSTLRVPDTYAGKKVKCPKCQAAIVVPEAEEEVTAEVADDRDDRDDRKDRIADAPARKRKPVARLRDEDDEEDDRRESVREGRKRARGREDEEEDDRDRKKDKRKRRRDEEDDDRRRPGKKKYEPCPRCGEEDAKKVTWTWWGSFYGPAMFNHVRCLGCGHCYNGRTGGSNAIPATIFFVVPLLLILAIIGGIFYMLIDRGVLK